jgi:GNAT superfamily N-acetyltransferase
MIRPIEAADLAEITRLRTSVKENHLSVEEMADRGITPAGILAELANGDLGGWVELLNGEIVGFSMADRRDGQIFALFTKPGSEGRGTGTRLLDIATRWLAERGLAEAWLWTDANSTAARFYANRGWRRGEMKDHEDVYFRLSLAR